MNVAAIIELPHVTAEYYDVTEDATDTQKPSLLNHLSCKSHQKTTHWIIQVQV